MLRKISEYKKLKKIFSEGSKTFSFAAKLMPKEKKTELSYLYYLCRTVDDIGDDLSLDNRKLAYEELDKILHDPEVLSFFNENNIPFRYFEDLVSAVRGDVNFKQPQTKKDLHDYCYGVAGTVGLMCAHMFGIDDEKGLKAANDLGIACQITNIMRDVEEDFENGRIYLAKEDMDRYSVTESQLDEKVFDENLRKLMVEYEGIARLNYASGAKGYEYLPSRRIKYSVRVAAEIYQRILDKIIENDYNPFLGRVYVTGSEKFIISISEFLKG